MGRRKKRVRWSWRPETGELGWEVVKAGVPMASSEGLGPVREALVRLMDLVSDLDDAGEELEAHRIMEEWVEMAWSIRNQVAPDLREVIEDACHEWWSADDEDDL
ncbi:hypothetical protein SAMN02746041_02489 [Desulfacinum hydrothermale DSM 13146]|uniref:Uncharacterized protein n=1 Tax=Desulfacinum hydrothermale DSM 13146 TaxID=1121390 RepID=A0A1W1XR56_9BACT|nr:hypothetical protein [Desulfacinum hydrothermale]SMC25991.1 hypothetical protein SAMN02746041_02489 [Desulfacinum hydrothermale DSM 13146]